MGVMTHFMNRRGSSPLIGSMKTCSCCKETKDLECFNRYKKSKDGYDYRCKSCQRASNKKWTEQNWSAKIAQQGERRLSLKEQLSQYKESKGCLCCDESNPVCLELHHLDPSQKEINPADMASRGWSWERMLTEIEKCVVVCSNCHKKIHANQLVIPE